MRHLALAVACDAYHKVSAAETPQPARSDTASKHRVEAAVRNAARRLGGLWSARQPRRTALVAGVC